MSVRVHGLRMHNNMGVFAHVYVCVYTCMYKLVGKEKFYVQIAGVCIGDLGVY